MNATPYLWGGFIMVGDSALNWRLSRRSGIVTELDEGKRGEIVDRVIKTVETRFYDPKFNGVDIRGRLESAKPEIIRKKRC